MDNVLDPLSAGRSAPLPYPAAQNETRESGDKTSRGEEKLRDTFEKTSSRKERSAARGQDASSAKAAEEKEYTILAYMDGSNNLEHYILDDLKEMEGCPPSDNYNLVVQFSRFQTNPVTVMFMAEALRQALKSPDFKKALQPMVQDPELISEYSKYFNDIDTCQSISEILLRRNPQLNDRLDRLVSGKVKEAMGQSRTIGSIIKDTVVDVLNGIAENDNMEEAEPEEGEKKPVTGCAPPVTLASKGPSLLEILGEDFGSGKKTSIASELLKAAANLIGKPGAAGSIKVLSSAGTPATAAPKMGNNIFFVESSTGLAVDSSGRKDAKETQGDFGDLIAGAEDVGTNTEPAWRGVRRYKIEHHESSHKIHSPVLADLGHVDMSSGDTLADFLTWGMKKYPAKHYIVIFSDHGAGFLGAEEDRGDLMSVPAIREAFEKVKDQTGKKPDIIAFDTCFMGQTEVANELKNSAKYLIASEEVIGGDGYPYSAILPRIDEAITGGKADPRDIAEIIMKEAEEVNESATFTLSTVDLEAIGKVVSAANDLAKDILEGKADIEDVRASVRQAQHYDHYTPGSGPYRDFRDLWDIADCIEQNPEISNRDIKKDVKELKKAIEATVVFEQHNDDENYENSHGLTVYAPRREDNVSGALFKKYDELLMAKRTKWNELIKKLSSFDESDGDEGGDDRSRLTFIPLPRR